MKKDKGREADRRSKERVMTMERKNLRQRLWAVPLACILFSSLLAAQAASPASGKGNADRAAQAQKQVGGATDASQALHDDYLIGPEDVLGINVWREPDISRSVTVRLDGAISLPLVGEVQASGRTPLQLEKEITQKLKSYISDPEVAVMVQEMRSKRFNVLGQVVRPGSYLLGSSITVLDAIALAGGFRDFAKEKAIYVLRRNADGTESRLPFNYKDVIKGKNVEQNIKLEPRDSLVVP
jgi:polysaccharide export outer membrane protein